MAGKLDYYKFRNSLNPFGTLFHPKAISNLIVRAIEGREFVKDEFVFHQEQWHSFEVHSKMSRAKVEDLITDLNRELVRMKEFLTRASHLVITLGTAWGYERKDNGSWVANCHKVPQKEFNKTLSSPEEIQQSLTLALSAVYDLNPGIALIMTVSPVRHIKDGFVENQRSKAHLLVALHRVLQQFSDRESYYFPAYELMMDELRDYRFYEADMLHPNTLAIDYIWEKFSSGCIDRNDYTTMSSVEEIQKGLTHRAFNPSSKAHGAFLEELQKKIAALKHKYPFMDFS